MVLVKQNYHMLKPMDLIVIFKFKRKMQYSARSDYRLNNDKYFFFKAPVTLQVKY